MNIGQFKYHIVKWNYFDNFINSFHYFNQMKKLSAINLQDKSSTLLIFTSLNLKYIITLLSSSSRVRVYDIRLSTIKQLITFVILRDINTSLNKRRK